MASRDDPRITRSRAAALTAAREILFEEGWAAVTHAAVAARSGVGRTTLYRHWPDAPSLLRDVITEQIEFAHTVPTGVLRDDLVQELDMFRAHLDNPIIERAVRVILERATVDPAYGALREELCQEGARVYVEIIRAAIERGELDSRLDPYVAVDRLVGPLTYRRLFAARTFTTDYVYGVVDDFLAAYGTKV
jgi:AcrR family transcriptional regulator